MHTNRITGTGRLGNLLLYLSFIVFLGAGCNPESDNSENQSARSTECNLVLEDNFDDLSNWNVWHGGAFNEEIQFYRESQVELEDGILKIDAVRQTVSGPRLPGDSAVKEFEYVSGRIESQKLFGPNEQDGEKEYRFMARIKLPKGHGMWPAFWLYGDPWPTQGEIDILEARGGEVKKYQSNIFYGTEPGINLNRETESFHEVESDLTSAFHIYEMIWREGSIDILFDGKLLHGYKANSNNNISNLFGKKQKIVFNTAVGGWFFEDRDSDNYADSATMEVDWVKVYKK